MQKFAECSMYAAYEVHTEYTLNEFENALEQWSDLLQVRAFMQLYLYKQNLTSFMQEYQSYCTDDTSPKDWNFPKAHLHTHAPRDICLKGALASMSTKISETFHGTMRDNYYNHTNFRDVMPQVGI